MPNPVTQEQIFAAINVTLLKMEPQGKAIVSLDTETLSDPNWSCNTFSPMILEEICKATKIDPEKLNSKEYDKAMALPGKFDDKTLINISMMGEPSTLNHNFNIFILGDTTYLIQVFLGKSVKIVQRFLNETFLTYWHNLSDDSKWIEAYNNLFGVSPADKPSPSWLSAQYVTL